MDLNLGVHQGLQPGNEFGSKAAAQESRYTDNSGPKAIGKKIARASSSLGAITVLWGLLKLPTCS